jgi:hypothetical protein
MLKLLFGDRLKELVLIVQDVVKVVKELYKGLGLLDNVEEE